MMEPLSASALINYCPNGFIGQLFLLTTHHFALPCCPGGAHDTAVAFYGVVAMPSNSPGQNEEPDEASGGMAIGQLNGEKTNPDYGMPNSTPVSDVQDKDRQKQASATPASLSAPAHASSPPVAPVDSSSSPTTPSTAYIATGTSIGGLIVLFAAGAVALTMRWRWRKTWSLAPLPSDEQLLPVASSDSPAISAASSPYGQKETFCGLDMLSDSSEKAAAAVSSSKNGDSVSLEVEHGYGSSCSPAAIMTSAAGRGQLPPLESPPVALIPHEQEAPTLGDCDGQHNFPLSEGSNIDDRDSPAISPACSSAELTVSESGRIQSDLMPGMPSVESSIYE